GGVPDAEGAGEEEDGPQERHEHVHALSDLDELAAVVAVGQGACVDGEQQEGHPVADDSKAAEGGRVEGPVDEPVGDDVLDVLRDHPEQGHDDVATVVRVLEGAEPGGRRGGGGKGRGASHCRRWYLKRWTSRRSLAPGGLLVDVQ